MSNINITTGGCPLARVRFDVREFILESNLAAVAGLRAQGARARDFAQASIEMIADVFPETVPPDDQR